MNIGEKETAAITPELLFQSIAPIASGEVEWGQLCPESGPGVYVITISDASAAGRHVVYIGRGKQLRRRISQFYRHKFGNKSPHRGGERILTLEGRMSVHWAAVDDYADAEHILLEAFRKLTGCLPYGNRVKSAALASTISPSP
jgi:hypothetical protein